MKPSPPKSPVPNFRLNSIPTETPFAAQRKASFWQINFPFTSGKSIGTIFPGYGAAKEAFFFPCP